MRTDVPLKGTQDDSDVSFGSRPPGGAATTGNVPGQAPLRIIGQYVADLMRSAGLSGFGVYSHLVGEDGLQLADFATVTTFATAHGLPLTGKGV
jgi:hypothetical protein